MSIRLGILIPNWLRDRSGMRWTEKGFEACGGDG